MARQWTEEECAALNASDPRVPCAHGCEWTAPYGWVPMADCPVHDPEPLLEDYYRVAPGAPSGVTIPS